MRLHTNTGVHQFFTDAKGAKKLKENECEFVKFVYYFKIFPIISNVAFRFIEDLPIISNLGIIILEHTF